MKTHYSALTPEDYAPGSYANMALERMKGADVRAFGTAIKASDEIVEILRRRKFTYNQALQALDLASVQLLCSLRLAQVEQTDHCLQAGDEGRT